MSEPDHNAPTRTIQLDFPIKPKVRFGWDSPPDARLHRLISRSNDLYIGRLREFQRFAPYLTAIKEEAPDSSLPSWKNDWIPALDAISLYCFTAITKPRLYFEIGSGVSTTFVRQSISDHDLPSRIISIDPFPRSEIDRICDEVIRNPVEDVDLRVFDQLVAGDMLFCDNSHRSFQNSDVTVFFTEILPRLKAGVMVGVHDIFLPHDYPSEWSKRFYNEQYLLACWLLGGDRLKIELPSYHCAVEPELVAAAEPLMSQVLACGAGRGAGAFWFTVQ